MENEIMGERLKGLYNAMENMNGKHSEKAKILVEIQNLAANMVNLAEYNTQLCADMKDVVQERDYMKEDYYKTAVLRDELASQKEILSKRYIEKLNTLTRQLEEAIESKEYAKAEHVKFEKRYKDLSDEYMKLRQRMKMYKFSSANQAEDKICKNCSKLYYETENFNWSCRVHPSEWSGEIYWCCGRTEKDAPGCRTAKHASKEEEEDIMGEDDKDKSKFASKKCSSCRQIGHFAHECPQDPNARSKFEPEEELVRIKENLNRKMKKGQGIHSENKDMYVQLLKRKLGNAVFASDIYVTDSEKSMMDSDEEIGARFFPDINRMKNESHVSGETFVKIEEFKTKEMEKEEAMFKPKGSNKKDTLLSSENNTKNLENLSFNYALSEANSDMQSFSKITKFAENEEELSS